MKQTFVLLSSLILLLNLSLQAQHNAVINGTLKKSDGLTVYLRSVRQGFLKLDSAVVKHDKFTLKTNVAITDWYLISLGNTLDGFRFLLDQGTTTFSGDSKDKDNFKASGTQALSDWTNYLSSTSSAIQTAIRLKSQANAAKGQDTAVYNTAVRAADKAFADLVESRRSWIKGHLSSPVALMVLEDHWREFEPEEVTKICNEFMPEVKKHTACSALVSMVTSLPIEVMNRKAPDFTAKDTADIPVPLKSFRGKYVLIDFWASWCGPCRAENPNVVKAYSAYHPKGFEILGVSLDQNKDPWIKAIHKDNLTWTQVSDLRGWGSEIAKLYNVTAIPNNFLVNPDGKIIGTNLRGQALEEKLKTIFK
jgi:peroxiredoxin